MQRQNVTPFGAREQNKETTKKTSMFAVGTVVVRRPHPRLGIGIASDVLAPLSRRRCAIRATAYAGRKKVVIKRGPSVAVEPSSIDAIDGIGSRVNWCQKKMRGRATVACYSGDKFQSAFAGRKMTDNNQLNWVPLRHLHGAFGVSCNCGVVSGLHKMSVQSGGDVSFIADNEYIHGGASKRWPTF
jgi:hypothetical protein